MHIAFITANYPSDSRPTSGTFVRQFVLGMAGQGNRCSVINPVSLSDLRHGALPPLTSTDGIGNDAILLHRPRFMSYSLRSLGFTHTGNWSNASFRSASFRATNGFQEKPDITYGHFMYPSGYTAISTAKKFGIPSVVGVGEGEFWTLEAVGMKLAKSQMREATAFLAVSQYLAEELGSALEIPAEKIKVFPNGVALDVFRPYNDRVAICRRLGFSSETFNIGYVGPFIRQKGYPQLREAVGDIDDIRLVLIGRGALPPEDPQIAFRGSVAHASIPEYLAACHIFVLPTLIEGSCNAVIEAMACGLPIVTSNGRYMDDIVDDEVAIRVDPTDARAIREAILTLKNDPGLCRRMSDACLRKAAQFDINERAHKVTAWMKELVRQGI